MEPFHDLPVAFKMNHKQDQLLFWGCFAAIITTSYAFISRMILCSGAFASDFGLDKVSVGELQGAGIWPFGVSIIIFSLVLDRTGFKAAMFFSFISYLVYFAMAIAAYGCVHGLSGSALEEGRHRGYQLLYWGSIILGLGNGSVEAFANPVVATLFQADKTRWLNRLHAGWPGGLVLGGVCTIMLANLADWRWILGLILIPAFVFFVILAGRTFPRSEREQAGVKYIEMLKELGAFGGLIGFGLVLAQMGQVFLWSPGVTWSLTALVVAGFAVVTRSFGRVLLACLILIMMPQAITELGTDGWITSLMQVPMQAAGHNPAWVLVYTSAIMMLLRFGAGPLIHKFSPVGLLAGCSALASVGLWALAHTAGLGMTAIFAAATLYAVGKTFFWPTLLGLTTEQCPRGGTLTLNAVGGIGMLAVGILGAPFIGYLQESSATRQLAAVNPALCESVTAGKHYLLGAYQAIDPVKAGALTDASLQAQVAAANTSGQFAALQQIALFPLSLFVAYVCMFAYFRAKGGYRPVRLSSSGDASA